VDAVLSDLEASPLSVAEKALLRYVAKVNDAPASASREDVEGLSSLGWSDAAVFDAVTVAALFAFFNRWIDGTGVPDSPPGYYAERLERFGDRGYAPDARGHADEPRTS
jgi:alkylhydroperoxidase family enzyme